MEKSDDITAPSAQSPQIPQDNVLHSPLGIRLDEALSSVSDWTEEMGLQIEGFPKNCQVLPPLPPRALFRVHRAGRSGICFKLLMPDYINCYQVFFWCFKICQTNVWKTQNQQESKAWLGNAQVFQMWVRAYTRDEIQLENKTSYTLFHHTTIIPPSRSSWKCPKMATLCRDWSVQYRASERLAKL